MNALEPRSPIFVKMSFQHIQTMRIQRKGTTFSILHLGIYKQNISGAIQLQIKFSLLRTLTSNNFKQIAFSRYRNSLLHNGVVGLINNVPSDNEQSEHTR